MFLFFIGLFAVVCLVHLVSAFFNKSLLRTITKICLLPLLGTVYVLGAKEFSLPVIFALVFGWGGDMFLLKISDIRFFRLGLASFLAGHLCYISLFIYFTGSLNITALVFSLAVTVPLGLVTHSIIRPEKAMNLPAIAYEIIIIMMSLSALQLMLFRRDIYGLLVFAGSLCFLLSDTLLAYFTFRTRPKCATLFVMSSYIAAQTEIIWGLMMF